MEVVTASGSRRYIREGHTSNRVRAERDQPRRNLEVRRSTGAWREFGGSDGGVVEAREQLSAAEHRPSSGREEGPGTAAGLRRRADRSRPR